MEPQVREIQRIAVFGASGGIGCEVVCQVLQAGCRVTAVIRDRARFDQTHPALEILRVPGLTDPAPLAAAIEHHDAVLSGVGPRSPKDGPVATTTTRGILAAMKEAEVRRLVAVSAVPVGPIPEGESLLNKVVILPLIVRLLRDLYADLEAMEEEIRKSGVDWTIVRPPKLVDGPMTGAYRRRIGGNVPRGYKISRADVADAMLAALRDPATIGEPLGVAE